MRLSPLERTVILGAADLPAGSGNRGTAMNGEQSLAGALAFNREKTAKSIARVAASLLDHPPGAWRRKSRLSCCTAVGSSIALVVGEPSCA